MGHYCRICGRTRANEKFSGKGHASHICKDCAPTLLQKHNNKNILLQKILEHITPENKHEEIQAGKCAGREEW